MQFKNVFKNVRRLDWKTVYMCICYECHTE